jgi:hypothetical protein
MNRHVNAIAGRLSLRPPQRRSLEILDRITEIAPPGKEADVAAMLEAIRSEFPSVTDFERDFPSLCFALATGVGKTRLMGAFISYLHLAHGIDNFFVLAPNLTIYNKLIADFSDRNHPKYVFRGIAEFAIDAPTIITGDNYDQRDPVSGTLFGGVRINIFNISKINSEVRGGKSPRIKRLSEYIGESYFDYLAGLPDLVMLMDESHRYRASAGIRAINELKPILGLELTATPFVETAKGAVAFKNVIVDYQRDVARFIHAQMQAHHWEDVAGYEVKISKGFTELKQSAYTYSAQEPPANYRVEPADKSNMAKYLFGGFEKCLYPVQKFDSDSERKLAVILEREANKWFKPAKGQFQIYYRSGADHLEYQPDFIAETGDTIYMLEPKKRTELGDSIVIAKQESAVKWCANASNHAANHAANHGGKPWRYVLIPHDEIAENMTLAGLAARFGK